MYPHWPLVDVHAVELSDSLVGAARFLENNCRDSAANPIWSVCEHRTVDRCDRLPEVFLKERICSELVD